MAKNVGRGAAVRILDSMLLSRRFEETIHRLWTEKRFPGHYHLYIGQEATGVGAMTALADDDIVFTMHRNHGHLVARGSDPMKMLAEILGRRDGLQGGRGGTFHLADPERGILQTSGLVGSCTALAAGAAHAIKTFGETRVSIVFFGDAAVEEGVTYEALNIASLWRLPVIFLCENNEPGGQGRRPDPRKEPTGLAAKRLVDIAKALDIPNRVVDGTDVKAVFTAVGKARRTCLAGGGPVFLETVTPGWPGNAGQYPAMATGETRLELAWTPATVPDLHHDWYECHDPVLRFCRERIAAGHLTIDQATVIDRASRARMAAATAAALTSPLPDAATALDHIFA